MISLKIDLHTHSIDSGDGSITPKQYQQILENKIIDFVAVTDHCQINLALNLRKKIGKQIIVGEEIKTRAGEIIGLFLEEIIPPFLTLAHALQLIKQQNGLVYIPHPLDRYRSGLDFNTLNSIACRIDIIEIFNPRSFGKIRNIKKWAKDKNIAVATSSDAHSVGEIGGTYTLIKSEKKEVSRENLVELLKKGELVTHKIKPWQRLVPTINRIKKLTRDDIFD